LNPIEFEVRAEPASLAHYRREWAPAPQVSLSGMWISAIVNDTSGQQYWGLRGADDLLLGMTHVVSPITGFKALQKSLDDDPLHLFAEYSSIDWYEPLSYKDSGTALTLSFPSGRFERDADGLHWYDATGRWEVHGTNITDVFTVHVPPQDGIQDDVYYRHELLKAKGLINGVEVSGYLHQDYAYGPHGTVYPELPIVRQLQGMWVSWMHEYSDGEWGGGCFWQGRDGLDFGPGYHVKAGVTTAHKGIVATPTFNDGGKLAALDVSIGSDGYTFSFDSCGSPIHYFGRMTGNSIGKETARSWCWAEYTGGMLTPELLDLMMQQFSLARGR